MRKETLNKILSAMFLTIILSAVTVCFGQQTPPTANDDEAVAKAKEVIANYRKATGINEILDKLAYLEADTTYSWNFPRVNGKSLDTYKLGLPNQIRYESRNVPDSLSYQFTDIWDGQTYSKKGEGQGGIHKIDEKIKLSEAEQKTDEDLRSLKWRTFIIFYPITFERMFYSPVTMKYAGIANSPDGGKADVLESIQSNSKQQYLFDKDTHLLLMHIQISDDKRYVTQYSEYRKAGGILIAHKRVVNAEGIAGFPISYEIHKFIASTAPKPEEFKIPEK